MGKLLLILSLSFWFLAVSLLFLSKASVALPPFNNVQCPDANFRIVNNTVECVACKTGFEANGSVCVQKAKSLNNLTSKKDFVGTIFDKVDSFGDRMLPENKNVGRILALSALMVFLYLASQTIYKLVAK